MDMLCLWCMGGGYLHITHITTEKVHVKLQTSGIAPSAKYIHATNGTTAPTAAQRWTEKGDRENDCG